MMNETMNTNTEVKEMKVAEKATKKYNTSVKNLKLTFNKVDGTTEVLEVKNVHKAWTEINNRFKKIEDFEKNRTSIKGFNIVNGNGETILNKILVYVKDKKLWYRDLDKTEKRAEKAKARAVKKVKKTEVDIKPEVIK